MDPISRAARVLRTNSYLVLATRDEAGPWAAALAYTLKAPDRLYFVSSRTSRHGAAIEATDGVAGVIYDSQAETADVESIQFAGTARRIVDDDLIGEVLSCDASEAVALAATDATKALYEVTVVDAYVLDQEAWEERQEDAREPVDFSRAATANETTP